MPPPLALIMIKYQEDRRVEQAHVVMMVRGLVKMIRAIALLLSSSLTHEREGLFLPLLSHMKGVMRDESAASAGDTRLL